MAYKVYMGKVMRVSNPKAKFTPAQNKFSKGLKGAVTKFVKVK